MLVFIYHSFSVNDVDKIETQCYELFCKFQLCLIFG